MKGYMIPRENGYFAVTDENGAFEIPNLPAGTEVEIQIWHESISNFSTLQSDAGLKVARNGRFKVTLPENGEVSSSFVVPAAALSPPGA